MKKIFLASFLLLSIVELKAQKDSGTITYQIANIDFIDKGEHADVTAVMLMAKKQQYHLNFNKSYSSFTMIESMNDEAYSAFHNKMAKIYVSVYDYYFDYRNKQLIEQDNQGALLVQKLKKLPWEITSESKMIDHYQCFKATYTFEYLARDQKMKTNSIVAWFAPSLPYAYGPKNYHGLPGLILELTDRTVTFLVSKIEFSDLSVEIKLPTGKRIPKEQFEKTILKN